jgi:hypothetical protein
MYMLRGGKQMTWKSPIQSEQGQSGITRSHMGQYLGPIVACRTWPNEMYVDLDRFDLIEFDRIC